MSNLRGERISGQTEGFIKPFDWALKLFKSRGVCSYCGQNVGVNKLQLDHIIPISRGGFSTVENITPACWPCNIRKRDKLGWTPKNFDNGANPSD